MSIPEYSIGLPHARPNLGKVPSIFFEFVEHANREIQCGVGISAQNHPACEIGWRA